MAAGPGESLTRLMNLGPVTARRLRVVGVETPADLRRVGAVDAYVRLRRAFPNLIAETMLYALHGALNDVRWYELSDEVRTALRHAAASRL